MMRLETTPSLVALLVAVEPEQPANANAATRKQK
jgi:hypothetical protein